MLFTHGRLLDFFLNVKLLGFKAKIFRRKRPEKDKYIFKYSE